MEHAHIIYGVPGMDERGGQELKERLEKRPGVHRVTVWLGEQQIDIDYQPAEASRRSLEEAIRRVGYMPSIIPFHERWPG